jgi:seryl-tRNA synthetase
MLDVLDFVAERGGDPKKVRESQRRRYASEDAVDEVIGMYEEHRKGKENFYFGFFFVCVTFSF